MPGALDTNVVEICYEPVGGKSIITIPESDPKHALVPEKAYSVKLRNFGGIQQTPIGGSVRIYFLSGDTKIS
jgi:hypothetical protein